MAAESTHPHELPVGAAGHPGPSPARSGVPCWRARGMTAQVLQVGTDRYAVVSIVDGAAVLTGTDIVDLQAWLAEQYGPAPVTQPWVGAVRAELAVARAVVDDMTVLDRLDRIERALTSPH
ncbi:hypothetical protein [Microcystis phage Mwe-JY05]